MRAVRESSNSVSNFFLQSSIYFSAADQRVMEVLSIDLTRSTKSPLRLLILKAISASAMAFLTFSEKLFEYFSSSGAILPNSAHEIRTFMLSLISSSR
jgi:hypothetical protein